MNEKINKIVEYAVENKLITNEKNFKRLVSKSFSLIKDSVKEKGEELADLHFKVMSFTKDFPACFNGVNRSELYKNAAEVLYFMFNELSIEVEKEECFIFFHFRELGKFRMKEDKVFEELKSEWAIHRDYEMPKADYEYALRQLKNHGLIGLRRGAITLTDTTVFRFKLIDDWE